MSTRRLARNALQALTTSPIILDFAVFLALILLTIAFYYRVLFGDEVLANLNLVLHVYPYSEYIGDRLAQGDMPLWNPFSFGGVPLLAEPTTGAFYPINWLAAPFDGPTSLAQGAFAHSLIASVGMYAFARRSLEVSRPAALIAGVVYAFGGFLPSHLGEPEVTAAAAWVPVLFFAADGVLRSQGLPSWPSVRSLLGCKRLLAVFMLATSR